MKNKLTVTAAVGFIMFTASSSLVVASGTSKDLAISTIISIKGACDRGIPGYAAATEDAFNKWTKDNSVLIEQAKKRSSDAKGFEGAVEKGIEHLLGKPKGELHQVCSDFKKSLNTEGL